MSKDKLISILNELKSRLDTDVRNAYYKENGTGDERLNSWMKFAKKSLDQFSKEIYTELSDKPGYGAGFYGEYSEARDFDIYKKKPLLAYLDSLLIDVENDEFDFNSDKQEVEVPVLQSKTMLKKAFIVHGHDVATQQKTARFLEQIGFEAIILSEKPSKGMTIIEKLEHYIDADGFGVVLYTPDDEGSAKNIKDYKPRARQNVVFEHGWLIGALGRKKVIQVVTDHSIELPNDISGVVYLSDKGWELTFMDEIHAMGYDVDYNLLRRS